MTSAHDAEVAATARAEVVAVVMTAHEKFAYGPSRHSNKVYLACRCDPTYPPLPWPCATVAALIAAEIEVPDGE